MKLLHLSLVLTFGQQLVSCVQEHSGFTNYNVSSLPSFVIDLDLPPQKRFHETAKHFRVEILDAYDAFDSQIPKIVKTFFEKNFKIWEYT